MDVLVSQNVWLKHCFILLLAMKGKMMRATLQKIWGGFYLGIVPFKYRVTFMEMGKVEFKVDYQSQSSKISKMKFHFIDLSLCRPT
jgi:hypothetical protein